MKALLISILAAVILLHACRKDSFITAPDARVTITADTLKYDTVFTSSGSVTRFFKIVNENNQKLRLSSVKIMGGATSPFKMNVDGLATQHATNIDIEANDSIYVFVQVNINPATPNLPFVVRDSIQVSYNGNDRLVQLEAWGQNAHFLRNKEVLADETWTNDLPYVILGYLRVNQGRKLTIEKGCRIYIHADAPIIIDGSLQVNGLKDTADRVTFSGDRLDEPYRSYPASWPGIFFTATSRDNVINFAFIRNSYQAIVSLDPSPNANPKVVLNECLIDNAYDAGIIGSNSSIKARNCLVTNCGKNVVLLGGNYDFNHCTVASYSNMYILHRDPVLSIRNEDINDVVRNLDVVFRNSILWGANGTPDSEVVVTRSANTGGNLFLVNFSNNLWKVQSPPAAITTNVSNINPSDPLFDTIDVSRQIYDFRLKPGPPPSPAIDKGINTGLVFDLEGKPRNVGPPDLGCFEKQP
ncbi:MAG: hypothetical protein H7Y42_03690 [Chitinophagaceae bacterium]|nr:hypothetical protein [Chitinophagaceae bacterium]